jgi:hypothetical protein
MDSEHHLVDLKASEGSTQHVPEEGNTKSPRGAGSHPQHHDEGQAGAAGDAHMRGEHHQHDDISFQLGS